MNAYLVEQDGYPRSTDAKPGMAYFAGTGPFSRTCGDCKHMTPGRRKLCEKYKELARKYGPQVRPEYPACKYFEAKR